MLPFVKFAFSDPFMPLCKAYVACCCILNKTWNSDVYLFDKLAQTQVVINLRDTAAPSVPQ